MGRIVDKHRSPETVFGFSDDLSISETGYWGSIQPMLAQLKTMIVGYEKYD